MNPACTESFVLRIAALAIGRCRVHKRSARGFHVKPLARPFSSAGYGCGKPTIRNFGEGVNIVAPLVFANPGTYTFACESGLVTIAGPPT